MLKSALVTQSWYFGNEILYSLHESENSLLQICLLLFSFSLLWDKQEMLGFENLSFKIKNDKIESGYLLAHCSDTRGSGGQQRVNAASAQMSHT